MSLTANIVGDDKVIVKLTQILPANVKEQLRVAVLKLAIKLQRKVVTEKLAGQVLKRVTGTLAASIQYKLLDMGNEGYGAVVGSRVNEGKPLVYAGIHEYGGVIPAHEVEAVNAQALRFVLKDGAVMFRKKVMIPSVTMPERSYLRSSLAEMSDEITKALNEAIQKGVKNES